MQASGAAGVEAACLFIAGAIFARRGMIFDSQQEQVVVMQADFDMALALSTVRESNSKSS